MSHASSDATDWAPATAGVTVERSEKPPAARLVLFRHDEDTYRFHCLPALSVR